MKRVGVCLLKWDYHCVSNLFTKEALDGLLSGKVLWRKNRWLLRRKENKSFKLGSTVDVDCAAVHGLFYGSLVCVEYVFGIKLCWVKFRELPNPAGRQLV